MKRKREIGRFEAISDAGKINTIIEYQIYEIDNYIGNQSSKLQYQRELVTTTGLYVNYIDDNTFMIVETGVIIRKLK
jgi:hypothetical protein